MGTGRIDDHLASDVPSVGIDTLDAAVANADTGDGGRGAKAHTAATRLGDIGHREIGRLEIAVGRAPERGLDPLEVDRRPQRLGLAAFEKLGLEAGLVGDGFHLLELFDAFVADGQAERTHLPPAGAGGGILLQLGERLDRPHGEPRAFDASPDLPHEPGRLRRGDGRHGRFLFQQQHVGLARHGQAVGNAAADCAAAHDDDFGTVDFTHHGVLQSCDNWCRVQRIKLSTLYSLCRESGPEMYRDERTPCCARLHSSQSCSEVNCQNGMTSSSW